MSAESPVRPFFDPASVLVVGASSDRTKNSGKPLYYLSRYGFPGSVAAVNPSHTELFGFPSYPTIEDVPEPKELALIMLPAAGVLGAARACGELGVRGVTVFGSGFADAGHVDLQQELAEIAKGYGFRLLGPNCLGTVRPSGGVTCSFSSYLSRTMFISGGVALATQSGSLGNAILLGFQSLGIGLSNWAATGNEADLEILDFVDYFVDDPDTRVVVVFAEAFRNARRWPAIAEKARSLGKPIVVLKAGISKNAASAVVSHSGRMCGSYTYWQSIARAAGLVLVDSLEELCDVTSGLAQASAKTKVEGLALVGTGGIGVLAADACERHDVPIACLQKKTKSTLRDILPSAASVGNPIDPTPTSREIWRQACSVVLSDRNVDVLLAVVSSLVHPHEVNRDSLAVLARDARDRGKVLAVSFLSFADELPNDMQQELSAAGAWLLPTPERVIRALGQIRRAKLGFDGTPVRVGKNGGGPAFDGEPVRVLGLTELAAGLEAAGLSVAVPTVVLDESEAAEVAAALGFPVVMKLEGPLLAHKSDAGAVRTGISTPAEVRATFAALDGLRTDPDARVIVQPQVEDGVEMLVACRRDEEFGEVITVGAGGTATELWRDMRSALAPMEPADVERLVDRTTVVRLLRGYRGAEPADVGAFCELASRLTHHFAASPHLQELELNPVIVHQAGAVAVDVIGVPSEKGVVN